MTVAGLLQGCCFASMAYAACLWVISTLYSPDLAESSLSAHKDAQRSQRRVGRLCDDYNLPSITHNFAGLLARHSKAVHA
jgi:hypothetical protein